MMYGASTSSVHLFLTDSNLKLWLFAIHLAGGGFNHLFEKKMYDLKLYITLAIAFLLSGKSPLQALNLPLLPALTS